MSLLGINPEAIPDQAPVAAGQYEVRLISLKNKDDNGEPIISKSGRKMIKGALALLGHEDEAPPVFFQFLEVKKNDNPQFIRMQGQFLKDFLNAFGLSLDITEEELIEAAPGLETFASIGLESDHEFGDRNVVNRFIAGR